MGKAIKLIDFRDKAYVFNLDEGMLNTLAREFNTKELVDRAVRTIEEGKNVNKVFENFGEGLAKRSLQLGEEKEDRTYGLILEVAAMFGNLNFPHVPERFIEIAYLGILPIKKLDMQIATRSQLTYRLESCAVFDGLKINCERKVVDSLPCKHFCLTLAEELLNKLDIGANVKMEATMPLQNYCEFTITKQ